MNLRVFSVLLFAVAFLFTVGDAFRADLLASPETVIIEVGNGIGHAIGGAASHVRDFFWG